MAGGSAGGHLALLTGAYLSPPPLAIISLYTLADPVSQMFCLGILSVNAQTDPVTLLILFAQTAEGVNACTSPKPPPGRDKLIDFAEVAEYMDESGPVVSRSGLDDLDLHACRKQFFLS